MIVEEKKVTLKGKNIFTTESGYSFDELTIVYETYGKLNKRKK